MGLILSTGVCEPVIDVPSCHPQKMGLHGMPRVHHLYIVHSIKPSFEDLYFLRHHNDVDAAVKESAELRWLVRLQEECDAGGWDYTTMIDLPDEVVLALLDDEKAM